MKFCGTLFADDIILASQTTKQITNEADLWRKEFDSNEFFVRPWLLLHSSLPNSRAWVGLAPPSFEAFC